MEVKSLQAKDVAEKVLFGELLKIGKLKGNKSHL